MLKNIVDEFRQTGSQKIYSEIYDQVFGDNKLDKFLSKFQLTGLEKEFVKDKCYDEFTDLLLNKFDSNGKMKLEVYCYYKFKCIMLDFLRFRNNKIHTSTDEVLDITQESNDISDIEFKIDIENLFCRIKDDNLSYILKCLYYGVSKSDVLKAKNKSESWYYIQLNKLRKILEMSNITSYIK